MKKNEPDVWADGWHWTSDDLLILADPLADMFEPPVPFAEYNTDESLRRMHNDPLQWEEYIWTLHIAQHGRAFNRKS